MASYEELKKRYSEGPSYHEKFRQQYGGPIKEQSEPVEERPSAAVRVDKAIENAISRLLPKATTIDGEKPKRDAAAYEQAKKEAREKKAMKGYAKAQKIAADDKAVYDADMKEIESWSDEDREQLQKYISSDSKTGNLLVNSNPLLWFGANKSLGDSAKYLYGKYGEEKTKQLASSYSRYLNETEAKKIEEDTKNAVDQGTMSTIGQNILGLGTRLFGGLQATADRFGEALDRDERYPTLAPYTSGDLISLHGNTVTAQTAQNIAGEDGGILRQGAAYLYQGGMTMMDSFLRAAASGGATGGAAIAACNAFSQTVSQASQQGATPEQAYTLGAAVAGVEYLTEKIPMDEVFKVAKSGKVNVLGQMFKQAGVEISTEELSLLGTMAAEAAIMREKSAYKQQIGEAIANGMSYAEAKELADKTVWEQVKQTAAVSGISGAASGGGSAIVGNVFGGDTQTPAQEAQAAEAAVAPDTQTQTEQPIQTQTQPDAAQAVAQELTQAQQAEAETQVAQEQAQEAIAQGMAEQYGPMMPQAEPKSQLQQDIDNATAAMLEENGIGKAPQTEAEVQVAQEQTNAQQEAQPVTEQNAAEETAAEQKIKGTGAAEANFTGTAEYDALLRDDNVQKTRELDARDVEVPKKDAEGKNVSRFVSNSMNAKVTPDSFTDTIKKMVIEGKGSYESVSDEASLRMAAEEIERDGGIVESTRKVREAAESGKIGNSDIAKAELLYQHLANDKNQISEEMAADIWVSLREMATISGRNLHLFSLMQKMTPEGRLMAVEKNIDRYVNSVNKNRSAKQKADPKKRNETIKQKTADAVSTARNDARETAINAAKKVKYKKGKVVVDWNQNGEPFVFEYAEKVGEALAKGLENKRKPAKSKTFLQEITSELKKFASEKMPPSQKTKTQTATELLKDYIQNQDFYADAWSKAQDVLRKKYANDPYFQEFINTGIGVDANANPQNKIMAKALAAAAMETGETTDILRRQQALGMTNMSETIADKLIADTGATGEMAQTIRDAAKEYVADVTLKADAKENAKEYTPEHFVNEAMRNIKKTMNDVARQDGANREKVKGEVVKELTTKYGFGQADASHIAAVIGDTFDQKAQEQAKKILEQKFAEREKAKPKSARETILEYANLGAFKSEYSDKAAQSFIRSAMNDIGTTISDLAKSGQLDKESARTKISDMIMNQHGISKEDADQIARVVEEQLNNMVSQQAKKILEQKFKPKTPSEQKTARQIFEEYANLGAFDSMSEYNEQATAKIIGDKYNATINSDLAEQFLNAKNETEQKEAMDAIYKDIASQIKPTLGEMWDTWRNLAMLGNAKTHGRNIGSTAAFLPYADVKRNIAATMEFFIVNKENRTRAILGLSKNDRNLVSWANKDAANASDAFQMAGTARNEAKNRIDEYRKILPGFLDTISKKNMKLMEQEDLIFKRSEYAKTLASYLKAKGYTAAQIEKGQVPLNVLNDGRQHAVNEALKATFNDRNKFSDAAAKLRVNGDSGWAKALNTVAKGVVPFTRTPANVVVRVAEYSPAGIAKGINTLISKVKTGEATVSDGLDQLAAGCTGTLTWGIGAAMAAGLIPGVRLIGRIDEEDDYPEEAIENSIQVGDKYYAIGWLAPAAVPLLIGANLYNNWKRLENTGALDDAWDIVDIAMNTFADVIDPILELSMLSSLKDVTDAYSAEETPGQGFLAVLTTAATNYFAQGIPTIMGQFEQTFEPEKTSTYVNTENRTEARIKKVVSNATQKIPGVDLYRTQKLDRWGNPVEIEANTVKRAFDAFINPFTVSKASEDPVDSEIRRLNKTQEQKNVTPPDIPKKLNYTDASGVYHDGYRLTEEQYQKIAETQGQTAKKILDTMTKSMEYKNLTDVQKAYAINAAYEYAQEKGKQAALPDYYSKASAWIAETRENDTHAFIARGAKIALDDAISNAVESIGNNWQVSDAAKADMEDSYKAFSGLNRQTQKKILDEATAEAVRYIETRKAGGTTKNYLDVTKNVKKLGQLPKDADIYAAVSKTGGMTDTAKDALMKSYMTDYDPDDKSPIQTEIKYDYMRQEMGLTSEEYATLMQAYYEVKDIPSAELKEKNLDRRDVYISEWIERGMTKEDATELYNLLVNTSKYSKIDVVSWHNRK